MGGYIDPNKQNQSQLKNELLKMYEKVDQQEEMFYI